MNDPEVGKAAVKIQAGFKNFMASKKKPKDAKDNSDAGGGGGSGDNEDKMADNVNEGVAQQSD